MSSEILSFAEAMRQAEQKEACSEIGKALAAIAYVALKIMRENESQIAHALTLLEIETLKELYMILLNDPSIQLDANNLIGQIMILTEVERRIEHLPQTCEGPVDMWEQIEGMLKVKASIKIYNPEDAHHS